MKGYLVTAAIAAVVVIAFSRVQALKNIANG